MLTFKNNGMRLASRIEAYSLKVILIVVLIHIFPFFAFTTLFTWVDIYLFIASYSVRVFALTAGYHRYFSHKSFQTSRIFQFLLAYLGALALQGGPLWWASHHRYHHRNSDTNLDVHSPIKKHFIESHLLWFMKRSNLSAHYNLIRDFSKYRELRFIERYWYITPIPVLFALYSIGGWNYVLWGYLIPTVFVNHVTYSVNSIVHIFGKRPFDTKDNSRNNWFIAILTFGEGWHNNHHRYAGSANQGFSFSQIDITFYILKLLSFLGIVRNLKKVPDKILKEGGYLK